MIRHRVCNVLMYDRIAQRLTDFSLDGALHEHVVVVMGAMPQPVLAELLDDPSFVMSDYDPFAGRVFHVPVGLPGRRGPGRTVVLKRTVLRRHRDFVLWVIAHELAHAHLRNGGRFPGEDPDRTGRVQLRVIRKRLKQYDLLIRPRRQMEAEKAEKAAKND